MVKKKSKSIKTVKLSDKSTKRKQQLVSNTQESTTINSFHL